MKGSSNGSPFSSRKNTAAVSVWLTLMPSSSPKVENRPRNIAPGAIQPRKAGAIAQAAQDAVVEDRTTGCGLPRRKAARSWRVCSAKSVARTSSSSSPGLMSQ
jgi:hypothetical protein